MVVAYGGLSADIEGDRERLSRKGEREIRGCEQRCFSAARRRWCSAGIGAEWRCFSAARRRWYSAGEQRLLFSRLQKSPVMSLGPKLIEIMKLKLSYGATIIQFDIQDKLFRNNFSTKEKEKLLQASDQR
ncbi:putative GEM-like protein [Helianthus annuus]|uniref:Uncharacterized protein n=1 Tax=Helianthus annuus TaxID=4232 RepID=A0A9K3NRQ2_HELAN|nr:hypothetical protein HanXRQr2_Chr04g0157471 [Helianthus annuus]KAJ0580457.1 putative GEM-like protein [Helianthus annuus]KAJ0596415.1 putative GEM-like protein [Helianthus annuus]KAJ0757074.1 putative GEM-like protein [Helianthus annuus]KAJ0760808.1 putative GEM-like protein [Helianthus annuus]